MITDIAEVFVAHERRQDAARRGIRKSAAFRTYTRSPRPGVATRP